jgi:hypothetical protein
LEYPDGYNIFYNFNTGEQVSLPKEMEDFLLTVGVIKSPPKLLPVMKE